jgi:hypothetical protein
MLSRLRMSWGDEESQTEEFFDSELPEFEMRGSGSLLGSSWRRARKSPYLSVLPIKSRVPTETLPRHAHLGYGSCKKTSSSLGGDGGGSIESLRT